MKAYKYEYQSSPKQVYIANSIQIFEIVNMTNSTDGLYVLKLPVDSILKRLVVRGNLKNIRDWKRHILWCEELGL